MKGKKILINACMITSQPSGVGIYSIELLKELISHLEQNKFKFTIYCYDTARLEQLNIPGVKKISLGFLFDKFLKNNQVIHRHIWNIIILNFLSARFDILYSFSSHGALFHKRQIITIHDLISLNFPDSHKSQYYYFKFYIPFLVRQSKHIIAISNFTKSEIIKHYNTDNKKISVIYNGINHLEKNDWNEMDENWIANITDKTPFCVCVGASYIHKNIETLLMVCERMKSLKVKFIIVSKPNSYNVSLVEKADDLHLQNVIFLPYVTNAQLALLYKQAKLNIYLSLYEGFGFPPAEAAFFGTQSLLSKQSALIEVYGEEFEYTEAFDVSKIKMIVSKYVFAEKKLVNNSYHTLKEKYSWKKTSGKVLNLFKTYLN